jgi:hypothetical protein
MTMDLRFGSFPTYCIRAILGETKIDTASHDTVESENDKDMFLGSHFCNFVFYNAYTTGQDVCQGRGGQIQTRSLDLQTHPLR